MRKKVTLKQLAKELNLSISTVSKSLKNDAEISEKTIKRVHELASFYNYKPNPLAVSLKSNKTKTIGVILPDILNHFFAEVLFGIEKEATNKGYKILTCITNESHPKEVEYAEMLNYSSVDGFIVALSQETQILNKLEHFETLKKDGVPIVMFDRVSDDIDCDKVIVDDKEASKNAVEHLIKTGCKNIAIVTSMVGSSVSLLRIEGTREASINYPEVNLKEFFIKDLTTLESEIENLLKENKNIDGVLGLDETVAAIAVNIANKLGYKIPSEISVIGFADGLLSKHSFPKLTSVSQHAEDLGKKATEILLDRLDNSAEENYTPKTKVIKTSLVIRDSTY